MLNKKELAFINSRIEQYRKWAKEEEAAARRASSEEDADERIYQARLNENSAITLSELLAELDNIK